MSAPRYARLASKVLVRERRSFPPAPPECERRTQAIAAVEGAIAARARRRRIARSCAVFVAAAALVVVTAVAARHSVRRSAPSAAAPRALQIVAHEVGSGANIVDLGGHVPLAEGRTVAAGSRVVTPSNGRATLAFSTGTNVVVDEATDMTIGGQEAAQILRLDAGSIELHVAKLGPGQRFLVDTPDAEVEVRGTRFRVSITPPDMTCGEGTITRVFVTEGVVVVRHSGAEARLVAGAQWPAGCVVPAARVESVAAVDSPGSMAQPMASPAPSNRATAASKLGEQNDLFGEAAAAKRSGDTHGALAAFGRFLAKYPASPLAESATVERMRLLRATAPTHAAVAAKQYLARYPRGFAHVEAEAIVTEGP